MNDESMSKARSDVENELFMEALRHTGIFELKVTGGSMIPTLLQGDTVALLFIPEEERLHLPLGAIVLRKTGERFMLHRIVGMRANPRRYLTKGDGLAGPDGWFLPEVFIARVKNAKTPAGQSFAVNARELSVFERLRLRWMRFHR